MTAATATTPETEKTLAEELGIEVGTIFYSSWGYDQTNVDYYRVVEVTPSGKSVRIVKVRLTTVSDDGGPTTYVAPGTEPVTGGWVREGGVSTYDPDYQEPPMLKRIQSYGEGERRSCYLYLNSYSSAGLWDGKPKYQTGSGWGH